MNEQILAMAKECGLCDQDGDFYGAKNSAYERFAQLIVRECARVASDYDGAHYVGTAIERHFGVEE